MLCAANCPTMRTMHDLLSPKVPKWPFMTGDLLLLGTAAFLAAQEGRPLGFGMSLAVAACVAAGAWLAIVPFVLEYRSVARVAEARVLTTALEQMKKLEAVAAQINSATASWQFVQDGAEKTAAAAKSMAERMAAELESFQQFMQRANDGEKANLRLELEKMHRAQSDWLQTLVRMLDHVYALHLGALRSGQPNLIEQLTNFQNACHDAARRVGLTPVVAAIAEPFDPERHQLAEGDGDATLKGAVAETIAAGYTFQGRMLRPALVRLQDADGPPPRRASESNDAAPGETARLS